MMCSYDIQLKLDNFENEKHPYCLVCHIITAVPQHFGSTAPTTRTIAGRGQCQGFLIWPESQDLRCRFSESDIAPSPHTPSRRRRRCYAAAATSSWLPPTVTSASPYTAYGGEG